MAQEVNIYNGLTRQKDVFHPINPEKVTFYSCGPTTYDFLHVGNARALVVGDLIYRIFRSLGYTVSFVRNFTDVDDKIIDRANELGINALEHSAKYVEECRRDMDSLNMMPPTFTPKVSESIPNIIAMIERIIERNHAYIAKGEVLFHVPSFKDYGKLARKNLEELEHGRRVAIAGHKKHPSDFVLWKPSKEGEPAWDSPWGKGRPGWHIECSAMSCQFLGNHFDLHHGGVDLIFPHHENEIAQSEAANGGPFCNVWIHNEFVHFKREKMSKSLGNVITIRNFVQVYGGSILRQLLCSTHYRSPLDWTQDAVDRAINDTERIHLFAGKIKRLKPGTKKGNLLKIKAILEQIKSSLADDFNMPSALGSFFSLIREFNRDFVDEAPDKETLNTLTKVTLFMEEATGLVHLDDKNVLNEVNLARKNTHSKVTLSKEEIEKLLEERKKARENRHWSKADEIREKLQESSVSVKDNPDGSVSWFYA